MLKSVRRASPMQGDCVVDPNSTVSQLTRRQLHLPPPTRLWNALVLKVKMDRTDSGAQTNWWSCRYYLRSAADPVRGQCSMRSEAL